MNHLQFLELQHLNAIVSLFFNDIVTGITATADANGNWSFNTTLIDSTYTLTATASDGQSTSAASAPLNITVNTTGFTLTAWTQRVVDLRAAKSTAFQNTFPIGTESEIKIGRAS